MRGLPRVPAGVVPEPRRTPAPVVAVPHLLLCSPPSCSPPSFSPLSCSWPAPTGRSMDAAMTVRGWEEDEGVTDDVTTAVVVAAHVATLLESRRRALAAAQGHRQRYRGSVPGRLANRQRNFELGLQCIFRNYVGVTAWPRFSVDNCLSDDLACRCQSFCGSTMLSRTSRFGRNVSTQPGSRRSTRFKGRWPRSACWRTENRTTARTRTCACPDLQSRARSSSSPSSLSTS